MRWNWQQNGWPRFEYDTVALEELEERFRIEAARLIGATSIIADDHRQQFTIALMSEEALQSSRIEGEVLNRDSVASSLLRQFGLASEYSDHRANDKEKGIAALMSDTYHTFDQPLSHAMLHRWHPYVVAGSWRIRDVGRYRTGEMRIVSGYEGREKVHFEAPPAERVPVEMEAFVQWFNDTAPTGRQPLPALARAGIAHIYFEAIHPFEDGNGRIGRAISEKALAQSLGQPGLFALSHVIESTRPEYYRQLEQGQKGLKIDAWLDYFSHAILDACIHSQKLVRFIVEKTRLYDRVRDQLNDRQEKALARMFAAGMEGFQGGLSAEKYIKMTAAPQTTATRDLQRLVELGALTRTGRLKGTRYWLNLGEEFEGEKRKHLAEKERAAELRARREADRERGR
jgi:Fic family protein